MSTLSPGDVVVMDNLSSHKGTIVHELMEALDAALLFLPPYSPDLHPIEMAFAKLKQLMRSPDIAPWPHCGPMCSGARPDHAPRRRRLPAALPLPATGGVEVA